MDPTEHKKMEREIVRVAGLIEARDAARGLAKGVAANPMEREIERLLGLVEARDAALGQANAKVVEEATARSRAEREAATLRKEVERLERLLGRMTAQIDGLTAGLRELAEPAPPPEP